jgi:leucyl/phenylalanyl-tRNA---protein transferase
MAIRQFPPVESADEYGLLAVGGDLEVDSLLLAYREGIFPWPVSRRYLTWFAPAERALLFLHRLHLPRSVQKLRRKNIFRFAIDQNAAAVIAKCAELKNRGEQRGTWITPAIQAAYLELHRAGYCHSFEAYAGDTLVGGLYGVSVGAMFAGESMFYRRANASKLALCFAADFLRAHGVAWIDCQVMTPLVQQLGAVLVPRAEFMRLLMQALRGAPVDFSAEP